MPVYLSPTAIGGLMHEHQVILRAVGGMSAELERISHGGEVDRDYLVAAIDFVRSYADRCHHGKEEDILFRDLEGKPLSAEDRQAMERLVSDHVWGRERTGELASALDRYAASDTEALRQITRSLESLVAFYPEHIEREDHGFFAAARGYFTPEERDAMADECAAFERSLVHERYLQVAEKLAARTKRT